MTIDYSRLRTLSARQLAAALQADGFELRRQRGSHRHCRHAEGRRATLSFHHASDTFPPPTLRSIIERQAKRSEDDFGRLGLLSVK
ncbi:MAG TPA: addiction module toxin, HicA family [Candidatus Hydrogenedentes bacterium]|nr:addiction module toxin, HicA family [Candidatus Hydrogenedentota bacterium]